MSYQTYIFDLDGTLLDTLDDLADAVNEALKSVNRPLRSREEVRSFVGDGAAKLIERALGGENNSEAFFLAYERFKEYYSKNNRVKTKPYYGVEKLLKRLNEAGKTCAIVSNKPDGAVKDLAAYFFPDTIKIAVGENEAGGVKRKPCPDSLFKVMELLGADEKKTVYIGDSEVDIKTAKNANLPCVSVAWGFKDLDFLKEQGATEIVTCPLEILNI